MRRPHRGPKPAWYYAHSNRISVRVKWIKRNADFRQAQTDIVKMMRRINRRRGRRLVGWTSPGPWGKEEEKE